MIKSILVPFGGGGSDTAVFSGAVTLGRRFGAHLDFYHVNISAGEAAASMPHAGYAMGSALKDMLANLQAEAEDRSALARIHFESLCTTERIQRLDAPPATGQISAGWVEDDDNAKIRLMARSRCRDLVVLARPHIGDGLPRDLLEVLVLGCGRPLIIVPDGGPLPAPETIMVCWKDCAEAARAAGAAMPFLESARRVVVAHVQERPQGPPAPDNLGDFVRQLEWHGVKPDVVNLARSDTPVSVALAAAARRIGADLMVMGAYRRSPLREVVFGGVTQDALDKGDIAMLLAH